MAGLLQPTSGIAQPGPKQLSAAVTQPANIAPSQRVAPQQQPAIAATPQVGSAQAMDPARVAAQTQVNTQGILPQNLVGGNMMQQLPMTQPGALMPGVQGLPAGILQQVLGTIIGQPQQSLGQLITGGGVNGF